MTKKQLCRMCTEYSADVKCEKKKECELQNILSENKKLKEEVRMLKKENENLQSKISWATHPDMMGK
jgi:predicted RNase H-like nuclease (RuvC/YqgF family)